MVGVIPFDAIRETGDRSWSLRLVEELAYGLEGDRDKIIEVLSNLGDRRTDQPLLAIVFDSSKTEAVRKAASDALFKTGSYHTEEERARWWASTDPVIVRHALLMSEPIEASYVTRIAADPTHSLYHEAIRTIEFWEPPEFQKLIIQALDHDNPRVRETAAKCLLWEQPVAAENRLLALASDADEYVSTAALDTLNYCSSREIILELDRLRHNGPLSRQDWYQNSFDYVQEEFGWAIPGPDTEPKEKAYMLEWLKPVKHLLKKRKQRTRKTTTKASDTKVELEKPELTARSIIEDLSEVDGLWDQKEYRYYRVDWAAFNDQDRQSLKRFFAHHADPMVREIGSRAFAAWQDAAAILSSLHDCDFGVLKTSAYHSRYLAANQAIANRLKELIEDPNVMNTFAHEALESFVFHSKSSETYDWLLELAKQDTRPSIRCTAVGELNSTDTNNRVKELVHILNEPPVNTWSLHCTILNGCERLWISRATVDYLKSIDNLFLQQ